MSEEINKKTNKDVTKRLQCISTDAASAIVDSTRIETSNQPQSAIGNYKIIEIQINTFIYDKSYYLIYCFR